MSGFLISDENPDGYKLEDILRAIRNEIIQSATKIMDDRRSEASTVINNDIKILNLLSETIELAESSTNILNKSFGSHKSDSPRIGVA
jgi:phosphoglycerate-specific signal transduction histidine kinase